MPKLDGAKRYMDTTKLTARNNLVTYGKNTHAMILTAAPRCSIFKLFSAKEEEEGKRERGSKAVGLKSSKNKHCVAAKRNTA